MKINLKELFTQHHSQEVQHHQQQQQLLRRNEFDFDPGLRPSPYGWDQQPARNSHNVTPNSNSNYRSSPFEANRSTPPVGGGGGHPDDRAHRRSVPLDFQRNQIQQQIHRSSSPAQVTKSFLNHNFLVLYLKAFFFLECQAQIDRTVDNKGLLIQTYRESLIYVTYKSFISVLHCYLNFDIRH